LRRTPFPGSLSQNMKQSIKSVRRWSMKLQRLTGIEQTEIFYKKLKIWIKGWRSTFIRSLEIGSFGIRHRLLPCKSHHKLKMSALNRKDGNICHHRDRWIKIEVCQWCKG
jgi:hypothetical protein